VTKVCRLSDIGQAFEAGLFSRATVCFGHFNTIHPGHIRYFRTAKNHGTPLVVAVEGDAQLLTAERSFIFPETERAQSIALLELVDYVVILDNGLLEDLVRKIDLSTLVLGKEFEEARAIAVATAVSIAQRKSVRIHYDAGETHYASTELFYGNPSELEKQRWRAFLQARKVQDVVMSDVFSLMSQKSSNRLLVLGDTIVDRYVACDPLGMSNEAPVVVVKEMETRDYVGGAGIVAAHVAALGTQCSFLSVTGADNYAKFTQDTLHRLGVESTLIEDSTRPTTFKIRYMVDNQKLFRVSRLKEHKLSKSVEGKILEEIGKQAPDLSGILVSDFVYGVVTPRIMEAVREASLQYEIPLFGDLQCSSQIGSVLKFQDFSIICPTEREARIALANQDDGIETIANVLIEKTGAKNLVLKLASEGFIAYSGREEENGFRRRQHFPALSINPVDVAGAGDALLSAMAVGLTRGLSLMQASALACCVSAVAVQTVGNRPINLEQVRSFFSKNAIMD
jgi:rfaE bifunctional protein kinase chain/domain